MILPRLAAPLGPLLLAAARGALAGESPARLADAARRRPSGSSSPRPAIPERPAPRRRDRRASTTRAATRRARLPRRRRVARPDGGWATAGGRVLTVVGRGRGPRGRAATPPSAAADAIAWPGMQRRRDIGDAPTRPSRSRRVIRRYTLPEMGAHLDRAGPLRADAPGRARRVPRAQAAPRRRPGRTRSPRSRRGPRSTSTGSPRSRRRPTTTSSRSSARSPRRSAPEGRYLHLGLTSSDVVDTALALQLPRRGRAPARATATALLAALIARARERGRTR